MTLTFSKMPHACTGRVTAAIEAYSPAGGTAHGNLDAAAYVCPNHIQTARDMWQARNLTPYVTGATGSSRSCGGTTDFRDSVSAVTPA